jgi:hypothetical protein
MSDINLFSTLTHSDNIFNSQNTNENGMVISKEQNNDNPNIDPNEHTDNEINDDYANINYENEEDEISELNFKLNNHTFVPKILIDKNN